LHRFRFPLNHTSKVCISPLYDVGFLQLAGGTNSHPVEELKREGLFQTTLVSSNFFT